MIKDCYVSFFLNKVTTIKNKDWENVKDTFIIPHSPLELEKIAICPNNHNSKREVVRYELEDDRVKQLAFVREDKLVKR